MDAAATTTTVSNATTAFSTSMQDVTLTAQVNSDAGPVKEGTVTFTIVQGNAVIGAAPTSGPLTNGIASVSYVLPAGTAAGSYTVEAVYNPGADFAPSSDTRHSLTITPAAAALQFTSVTVVPNLLALNQTETFRVYVAGSGGVVHQGTVTFSVDGKSVSAAVDGNRDATASLTLPLLTAVFPQSIQAIFSGPNRSPAIASPSPERGNNPQGEGGETFILTTEANELMCPLRERMPVIVGDDVDALWLESRSAPTRRPPTCMQGRLLLSQHGRGEQLVRERRLWPVPAPEGGLERRRRIGACLQVMARQLGPNGLVPFTVAVLAAVPARRPPLLRAWIVARDATEEQSAVQQVQPPDLGGQVADVASFRRGQIGGAIGDFVGGYVRRHVTSVSPCLFFQPPQSAVVGEAHQPRLLVGRIGDSLAGLARPTTLRRRLPEARPARPQLLRDTFDRQRHIPAEQALEHRLQLRGRHLFRPLRIERGQGGHQLPHVEVVADRHFRQPEPDRGDPQAVERIEAAVQMRCPAELGIGLALWTGLHDAPIPMANLVGQSLGAGSWGHGLLRG
ncbi:MAG TPA: Ig-like domain repeat protein [Gemmataceae bacterium]